MQTLKNILDVEYIKKHTKNLTDLKVSLRKSKTKGTSLYARKNIRKNEVIAYYKFTIYSYKTFSSRTKNVYTFTVNTKSDNYSRTLIGDISEDSLEAPINGIPFWGYFANEPSGDQEGNAYIDTNIKENYKNKSRLSPGDTMIYKLRASKSIKAGEEITWCYGSNYGRDYVPNCD